MMVLCSARAGHPVHVRAPELKAQVEFNNLAQILLVFFSTFYTQDSRDGLNEALKDSISTRKPFWGKRSQTSETVQALLFFLSPDTQVVLRQIENR